MTTQTIKFSELPKSVLIQIPFSLRTSGDKHVMSELPSDVQYIIQKYLDFQVDEITYENTFDVKPEVSVYNDLVTFDSVKDLIIHYLKNYLLVSLGSYPFDCQFGCLLKKQLQTKDTSLRSALVGNEIGLIAGVLGDDYNMDVRITNIDIAKTETSTHTEYNATIIVEIDDESFEITV